MAKAEGIKKMNWFTDGYYLWTAGHKIEAPLKDAAEALAGEDCVTTIDAKRSWENKKAFLTDRKVRQWIQNAVKETD